MNFGTSCHPVILINCFITFNANEVLRCCQFAVKIAGGNNYLFIFRKTSGGFFHDRECNRKNFVECFLVYFKNVFFYFVNLSKVFFTKLEFKGFGFCFESFNFCSFGCCRFINILLDFLCFCTECIIV